MRPLLVLLVVTPALGCSSRASVPEALAVQPAGAAVLPTGAVAPPTTAALPPPAPTGGDEPCTIYEPPRRTCCHEAVARPKCCSPLGHHLLGRADIATTLGYLGEGSSDKGDCAYTFGDGKESGTVGRAALDVWDAAGQSLDDLSSNDREGKEVTPLAGSAGVLVHDSDGEGAWIEGGGKIVHLTVDHALFDRARFASLVDTVKRRLAE